MLMPDIQEEQGWLTFAQNSDTVDYLKQAYLLALSVKTTCKINSFAVAVDKETEKTITDRQREIFDYIVVIPKDEPFYNEWRAWEISPFRETFKVESDMLIPCSVDHWWDGCRLNEVAITTNVRDYKGNIATSRYYRKLFDDNYLIDTYNGFMYFRHSRLSADFFSYAKQVFDGFSTFRDRILINCRHDKPDTDVVYGIVCNLLDNKCHIPVSYPTFTHMKSAINNWKPNLDWRDAVAWTLTENFELIVGGYIQQYPFHYFHKDFCTDELVEKYERRLGLR